MSKIVSHLVCFSVGYFIGSNYKTEFENFISIAKNSDSILIITDKDVKLFGKKIIDFQDKPNK